MTGKPSAAPIFALQGAGRASSFVPSSAKYEERLEEMDVKMRFLDQPEQTSISRLNLRGDVIRRVLVVLSSLGLVAGLIGAGAGSATAAPQAGSPDTAFNEAVAAVDGLSLDVRSVAVDSDGKIIVAGNFTDAGGTTGVNRLARFKSNGEPDTEFNEAVKNSGGLDATGYSVAVDSDDNIVVAGNFTTAGGNNQVHRLARFKNDGTADALFNQEVATAGGLSANGWVCCRSW